MKTIEVTVLADNDEAFVVNILNALAQRQLIEFDLIESFPAEGPMLTDDELTNRLQKAETGKTYSYEEALRRLNL
ncbi:hypothetical protein [Spirosoma montaniterrae]|uniref:Uncharacterized protein n=1 Tax=Spirosoma montaniterrae TaxID=1178516 RepID=A0A1P9WX90_9BACT|nr:hypothetical protein [Spirosoma montaniterrae]AQG79963.1 hypothetical protein AWR27_11880 [Spirosoma montaniterrae]